MHFGFNGMGIVIHERCVIGTNVVISQPAYLGGGVEMKASQRLEILF